MSSRIITKPSLRIRVRLKGSVVEADLVKSNERTIWVRLADGRIIQRDRRRDLVGGAR